MENDQNNVWNKIAEDYNRNYDDTLDWKLGYNYVEAALEPVAGKKLLDFGCGPGKFSRRLNELGAMVTGVDQSEHTIHIAKNYPSGNIRYFQTPPTDLSALSAVDFDAIVANFVFCTFPSDKMLLKILGQFTRILNKQGKLILLEPNPNALNIPFFAMKRVSKPNPEELAPVQVYLKGMATPFYDYWRSADRYTNLLEQAGFELLSIQEPVLTDDIEQFRHLEETRQAPFIVFETRILK